MGVALALVFGVGYEWGIFMRYAIVSDLHANLQAWKTVLADTAGRNVDKIICLGDVIGYGPRPAEVLTSAYQSIDYFVLGNHDAVIGGCLDPCCFNEDAQRMICWTADALDTKAKAFFRDLPLALTGEGFRCVHGSACSENPFDYVTDENSARDCVHACEEPLIFVGHSHDPQLYYFNRQDEFRQVAPIDFIVEPGKRYIVNCGSVGMPRDGDFRASYCIYDDAERSISFYRIAYDVDEFRLDVQTLIPSSRQAEALLAAFDDQRRSPLRIGIDFAPEKSKVQTSAPREQQVIVWQKRTRRWRWAAVVMLILCVASVSLAWAGLANSPKPLVIESDVSASIHLQDRDPGQPLNLFPGADWSGTLNDVPPGFLLRLADSTRQSFSFRDDQELVLHLDAPAGEVCIQFPDVILADFRKAQLLFSFDANDFQGELPVLHMDLVRVDGELVQNYDTKTAVQLRDGSYRIQRTTRTLPKDTQALRLRLICRGYGTLRFKECQVTPRIH